MIAAADILVAGETAPSAVSYRAGARSAAVKGAHERKPDAYRDMNGNVMPSDAVKLLLRPHNLPLNTSWQPIGATLSKVANEATGVGGGDDSVRTRTIGNRRFDPAATVFGFAAPVRLFSISAG